MDRPPSLAVMLSRCMSIPQVHYIDRATNGIMLLALLAACAKHSVATPDSLAPRHPVVVTVGPLPTDSTPAGSIRGVVVDESTGRGIESAYVSVANRTREGRRIGVVTDALGRFQFSFAPFDSFTIQAGRIAYSTQLLHVRLNASRGYTLVLALPLGHVFVDPVCGPSPVTIVVRDVLSGGAPPYGATAELVAHEYRDSTTAMPAPDDSALVFRLGTPGAFMGDFSIVVQSPGFRSWRADVVADKHPCAAPPALRAWLLPN